MNPIKKLFALKRPGRRTRQRIIPYHEDRDQRKRWKREKLQQECNMWSMRNM